jgi:hypothetical protein
MKASQFCVVLFFVTVAHIGFTPALLACDCRGPSFIEAYRHADAIFIGVATAKVKIASRFPQVKTTFRVEMAWRGVFEPTVDVFTIGGSGACGFPFAVRETYLIYASYRYINHRSLETFICTRTAPLGIDDDPIYISSLSLTNVGPGARIFGFASTQRGSETEKPLPNTRVIAENSNQRQTVSTDFGGKYEFLDLKPGRYRVYLEAPADFTSQEFVVELQDIHQYARHDFLAKAPRYPLPF